MKRIISNILLLLVTMTVFIPIVRNRRANVKSSLHTIPNVQKIDYIESGLKFQFKPTCRIVVDSKYEKELKGKGEVFAKDLRLLSGYRIRTGVGSRLGGGNIFLTLDWDSNEDFGEEGYIIDVRADYIRICGKTEKGVFLGTRTVLQWLNQGFLIPELKTVDYPVYEERSSMIDVARKYFSVEYIKNHIREISYLKYNFLYLHLTDNEAFRLECETYPEIVSEKHYTKKEIKEIIEFGKRYNITVIPEIEMPGHMAAVTKVYPNWQLKDFNGNPNPTRLDLTNPEVYTFIENLLDEYIPLVEGKYFHIGADEYIPLEEYGNYPKLRDYAKEKYGEKAKAVDVYYGFINYVNEIVKKHGKITRMWNDGLGPSGTIKVSDDIVVDVWITNSHTYSASELIREGYTLGNSNTSKLYYVLGIEWASSKPDDLYETFEPYIFVNNDYLEDEPKNLGAKMQLWCDKPDSETEEELYVSLQAIYRALAQKNWGSNKIVESYNDFKDIMNKVGNAPGFTGVKLDIKLYDEVKFIESIVNKGYVEVNLGQVYYIDECVIETKGKEAKISKIVVSMDRKNWSEKDKEGQFVRIYSNSINDESKIYVYGELLPDNLALNKQAEVSTEYDKKIWPASYTVDGLLSTRWSSFDTARSKGREWLMVDLEEVYNINGVAIYWEAACPGAYTIEVSEDGDTWIKVYEVKDADGGTDVLSIDGKGRYVRITATNFLTPYGISIFEFKVFGYK